jgi:hypothetical protein
MVFACGYVLGLRSACTMFCRFACTMFVRCFLCRAFNMCYDQHDNRHVCMTSECVNGEGGCILAACFLVQCQRHMQLTLPMGSMLVLQRGPWSLSVSISF